MTDPIELYRSVWCHNILTNTIYKFYGNYGNQVYYVKCNLTLAVSPTCPQHKSFAYLWVPFSITSQLQIGKGLVLWHRVKASFV